MSEFTLPHADGGHSHRLPQECLKCKRSMAWMGLNREHPAKWELVVAGAATTCPHCGHRWEIRRQELEEIQLTASGACLYWGALEDDDVLIWAPLLPPDPVITPLGKRLVIPPAPSSADLAAHVAAHTRAYQAATRVPPGLVLAPPPDPAIKVFMAAAGERIVRGDILHLNAFGEVERANVMSRYRLNLVGVAAGPCWEWFKDRRVYVHTQPDKEYHV